ncbi:hypothetical protein [Stenotrophomonas phage BUCTxx99]|nr:hypothetical protein [Stenotrophomonas phage BUCTxx99]
MYHCQWCNHAVVQGKCTQPYGKPCPPPANGRGYTRQEIREMYADEQLGSFGDEHNGAGCYDADQDFA